MLKQPLLPGFRVAPQRTDHLFFAIRPDAESISRIVRTTQHLRGQHGLTGGAVGMECFHVTLHSLGTIASQQQQDHIVALANEVAATVAMPPFEVMFDRAMSFSGKDVDPEGRRDHPFVLLGGDGIAAVRCFSRRLAWQ